MVHGTVNTIALQSGSQFTTRTFRVHNCTSILHTTL